MKFTSFPSGGFTTVSKGGLISESFSLWLQSPKKVPSHSAEQLVYRWIVWQYGLWSFQTGGAKLERLLPMNQHTQRHF